MRSTLFETHRPDCFDKVYGQGHLVGKDGILRKFIAAKSPFSFILQGPCGTGKTSIARIYGNQLEGDFFEISALDFSVAEIKKIVEEHKGRHFFSSFRLVIFIDEIHRLNKAQQDFFLPLIENNTLILIGATTESPYHHLQKALLSRLEIFLLKSICEEDLALLLEDLLEKREIFIESEAKKALIGGCFGDARVLIKTIEKISLLGVKDLDLSNLFDYIQKDVSVSVDTFYDLASRFQKSIRSSLVDGALYYLAAMLGSQINPLYILRRLLVIASEDIGLADPHALTLVNSCFESYEKVGMPEGEYFLAQATIYLALAPKSRSIVGAISQSKHELDVSYPGDFFEKKLNSTRFYEPTMMGFEKELLRRLEFLRK